MSEAFSAIKQNLLGLNLVPINVRELLYLRHATCDFYVPKNGLFIKILKKGEGIDPEVLREIIQQGHVKLFVKDKDRIQIIHIQQDNLRTNTRSLSIGNPLEKGRMQIGLLTINMMYLYEDPTDDVVLNLQYQSIKSLSHFLMTNVDIHPELYREYSKKKHHYIFSQPMLSSIFLVGVLKQARIISDKEIESLFITSYFKDIGMSAIPKEKYDESELSREDKKLLHAHAQNSVKILSGRIPLSPSYLKLIENHHCFSILSEELEMSENLGDDQLLSGFETIVISVMDIIAAMISERPYREGTSLYDALELIRKLIAENYPQEFKLLVNYFKNFFTEKQT